jgi:hypothetical protein
MRRVLRALAVVGLAVAAAVLAVPGTASAAPTTVGYDVSHPQCGKALPEDRAFGIVGVNGGRSTSVNPCLSDQLAWAWGASGAVLAQPKAQLYLNTGNPGEVRDEITTWPSSGTTPYGSCNGANSQACSWQYGWERAQDSVVSYFVPAAQAAEVDTLPADYVWWLDVETGNTWQSGSTAALARNRATLEGMTSYLLSRGAGVGLYSTARQWGQIIGNVPSTSNLAGRASWLPGASTLTGAKANCRKAPLTPRGDVVLAQYVKNRLDRNLSC